MAYDFHNEAAFDAPADVAPIGFDAGTLIETETGPMPALKIRPGDLVLTASDGFQPVRWVSVRRFDAGGSCAPVVFAPGAVGNTGTLTVSPLHRIAVSDWRAQLMFGEDAVLVPAYAFVNGRNVRRRSGGTVNYVHLIFDRHRIIYAEGAETEGFFPGNMVLGGMDPTERQALLRLNPALQHRLAPSALPDVSGSEAAVLLAA